MQVSKVRKIAIVQVLALKQIARRDYLWNFLITFKTIIWI